MDKNTQTLKELFNSALSWGATYGPILNATQWHEMREKMAEQYCNAATTTSVQGSRFAMVPIQLDEYDHIIDAGCEAGDMFRVDFMRAWDAAIFAATQMQEGATNANN